MGLNKAQKTSIKSLSSDRLRTIAKDKRFEDVSGYAASELKKRGLNVKPRKYKKRKTPVFPNFANFQFRI